MRLDQVEKLSFFLATFAKDSGSGCQSIWAARAMILFLA